MTMHFAPSISFPGNGVEALNYYHEIFGGELEILTYGEMSGDFPFDPDPQALAHGMLTAGDLQLVGGDALGEGPALTSDVYTFLLMFDTPAEAEELIAKFTGTGGEVSMPFEIAPWGDHYGQVTDRYGVRWEFVAPTEES